MSNYTASWDYKQPGKPVIVFEIDVRKKKKKKPSHTRKANEY